MITSPQTTTRDVAGHYDELDRFYRELWGDHVHHGLWLTGRESPPRAVEQLIDRVAAELDIKPGDRLCDIGCGYGATSRYLARNYAARMTGLTVSQAQFNYARQQDDVNGSVKFLLQDWTTNTLPSASFDGMVSIECVSHVPDKRMFFEQIRRVLRPGGKAAVIAWLTSNRPTPWERRWLLEPICHEGRLPGMANSREYAEMIEQSGLDLLNSVDLTKQVRRTWWICARRLAWGLLSNSSYRRFLMQGLSTHAIFAKTVFRILLAYHTGAMRYGLFTIRRPTSARAVTESSRTRRPPR